jgi:MFS family permease
VGADRRSGGWTATVFASLRIRAFRVLMLGSALSFIGFMMSSTAQNVVAYDRAGSNRAVGAVQLGNGLAMLALAPVAGALADRLSKRLVLLVCQSVIGLTMAVTALLIATGAITIFLLAAGAFVMGVMFAFLGPARQAYVGEIVELERRGNAVALSQVVMNAARVVGPFVAGGLLAWPAVGPAGTFWVMAGLFVLVVATLAQLPPTAGRRRGMGPSMLADIALGLQHVSGNPRLRLLLIGFVLVVILSFPSNVIMPGFAKAELGVSTAGLGLLLGVSAVGGLMASLLVAALADSPRAPLLLTLSSLAIGAALVSTGLAPTFAVALATMFCFGAVSSGFQTLNNALVMREADPAYYGRVMSITMVAYSGTGLVALPVGLLADAIGARAALALLGAAVTAVAGLLALAAARLQGAEGRGAGPRVQLGTVQPPPPPPDRAIVP